MLVKSICCDFQCKARVFLTQENMSNLDFFVLDRSLRSASGLVLQFTVRNLVLTAQLGLSSALDVVTCHLQVASLY